MITGILSLAVELLQEISHELGDDKKDIGNLRVVCKQLNIVLAPQFFSHLVLNIHKHRIEKGKSQLEALASGQTAASKFAKSLKICSLAPSYDPHIRIPWEKIEIDPEAQLAIEHMGQYLAPALSSLQKLQDFSWTIGPIDPDWTGPCIVKCLASLPSLESIELHVPWSPPSSLPLDQLAGLRRIVAKGHCKLFREAIVQKLGRAISNSPQLSYLDVSYGYLEAEDKSPTLHDLLGEVPLSNTTHLKHLGLEGWRTRLDVLTLPHLRSLTSLKLENNYAPFSPLAYNDWNKTQDPYSSETYEIWRELERARIHLTDLDTDSVDDALLKYLSSYSGLEKLTLSYATSTSEMKSNELADEFYSAVLPKHASSLVELSLNAGFEGNWCFGVHNSSALSLCQGIKHLLIGVNSEWIPDGPLNIVDFDFMLNSVTHLPQIRCLTLVPADYENHRDARCGNPTMRHLSSVRKALENAIAAYKPYDPSIHLPEVRIGSQVY